MFTSGGRSRPQLPDKHENRVNIKKTLSAPVFTFIYKFIVPTVFIGGWGLGTIGLFFSGDDTKWGSLIAWVLGSVIIYFSCMVPKVVKVDDNFLYISNYREEISVQLSDIKNIKENIFLNDHPIYIELNRDTLFGKKIMFIPKGIYMFRRHPVVKELRDMVQKSKTGGI